jgi:hypothetical protein
MVAAMAKITRRRYDTTALVGQLRKDKRNGLILGTLGLIVVAASVYYYFSRASTAEKPKLPESGSYLSATKTEEPAVKAEEPAPAPEPQKEPTQAMLSIALPKAAPLWVGDKLVGTKIKTRELPLAAGEHTVKTKVGRKTVAETIVVEDGKSYRLSFDAKKKRWVTEAVASPPK